jgi:hypothetical protein
MEVVPFRSLDTQSQAGSPSVSLVLLSLQERNFSIGSPDLAVGRGRPSPFWFQPAMLNTIFTWLSSGAGHLHGGFVEMLFWGTRPDAALGENIKDF